MILGFLVVSSVLIVSLGRLGDMYGRVKMYNLGFVIYTLASLLLTIDWMTGQSGAGRLLFPQLISGPFATGLHEALLFAIVACLIAAGASLMRGGRYRHGEQSGKREPGKLVGNREELEYAR